MGTNDLGSKKINGVQKNIDESKGKNISHDGKADDANLKKEVERLFYDTQEINLNNEVLPENAAALVVIAAVIVVVVRPVTSAREV